MIKQEQLHPVYLDHIVHNMRADDAREIYALRWDNSPQGYIDAIMEARHRAFAEVFCDGKTGEPISVVGAFQAWPNVWQSFAFGTDRWDDAVISMTRYVRRTLLPGVFHLGAHRAQAWGLADHDTAEAWVTRALGARREATLSNFGRGGEDFNLYAWDRDDARAVMGRYNGHDSRTKRPVRAGSRTGACTPTAH